MESFINFRRIRLAHRGLHDAVLDENSLGAFKSAVAHGYGIELDVHLTKDGTLAVVHDGNLSRVANLDISITAMTASDLAKTKLLLSGEAIPTLVQVLEVVQGKVPLLIEMKVDGAFDPALPEGIIEALSDYPDDGNIAVQSFNPYAMRWLRKNYPHRYPYGQLVSHDFEGQSRFTNFMFRTLLINLISRPLFTSMDVNYLPDKHIRRARRRGMNIICWTVDSDSKRQLAEREADNYIFERIRPQ